MSPFLSTVFWSSHKKRPLLRAKVRAVQKELRHTEAFRHQEKAAKLLATVPQVFLLRPDPQGNGPFPRGPRPLWDRTGLNCDPELRTVEEAREEAMPG